MSNDGLREKFRVERTAPSSRGIDHSDCQYFVLDPKHDPGARFALRAYKAWARKHGEAALAEDLDAWLHQLGGSPFDEPTVTLLEN